MSEKGKKKEKKNGYPENDQFVHTPKSKSKIAMSFGFSPSDIVVAYQLAHKIHYHCFTKAQRAGKLYCVYYINFHALGEMT